MTEYTLRTARKIETRLGEYINLGITTKHEIHASNVEPEAWLNTSNVQTEQSIHDVLSAITLRFNIRSKIQTANNDSINTLIIDRKSNIEESKMMHQVVEEYETQSIPCDIDIVKHKLHQLNNSINSGHEYSVSTSRFVTISESVYNSAKKSILNIRHEIEQIDLELANLNNTTHIVLNDKQRTWLTDNDIL